MIKSIEKFSTRSLRALSAMAASVLLLTVAHAEVQTQNFFMPKILKKRVDRCLEPGNCGKVAAIEFCKTVGYADVDSFSNDSTKEPTIYLGSGATCEPGNGCVALKNVVCTRDTNLIVPMEKKSGVDLGVIAGAVNASKPDGFGVVNDLGGKVKGELAPVNYNKGSSLAIGVAGHGMDDALWFQSGTVDGKWKGWKSLGGKMKLSPSCAYQMGRIFCAVVGLDDAIWVNSTAPGNVNKWLGFGSIGGKTQSSPSVVKGRMNGRDAVFVFVRTMDNLLSYNAFVEDPETELSNWRGWEGAGIGLAINSSPSCIFMKGETFNCYSRNPPDNGIRELQNIFNAAKTRVLDGATEKLPRPLMGGFSSMVRLLVTGLDGKMWVNTKSAKGNWGQFKQTEYSFPESPVCLDVTDGEHIWCFAVKGDGSTVAQNFPASAFNNK